MNTAPWWVTTIVSGLPAIAAITAAVLAGRFAKRARVVEIEAQRLRDLEARLADKKYDVYRPMMEMLGAVFVTQGEKAPEKEVSVEKLSEFAQWISIYGSDEAVRSYRNFMQSAFHSPPPEIYLRIYADFVIAARRDMGLPSTDLTAIEILGMRLTDLYASPKFYDIASRPFEEVCAQYDWQPPWLTTPDTMSERSQVSESESAPVKT